MSSSFCLGENLLVQLGQPGDLLLEPLLPRRELLVESRVLDRDRVEHLLRESVAPSRIAHASRPRVELVQPLLAAPAAALPARKVEDGRAGAADGAAAGHREDLLPHVEVARQLLRAGPPPGRQPSVELERVPGAAVGHAVLAAQEQLAVERELEVDAPVVDAPVRVDPERQRVGEIALGEERLERLDVLR